MSTRIRESLRHGTSSSRRDRPAEKYDAYRESLDRLWQHWVSLGRTPDKTEVADLVSLTEGFGTLGRALRFVEARMDLAEATRSRDTRIADLEVYFALSQFERRKPYKHLERGLQRDIKEFFGNYRAAQAAGFSLLMQIADAEAIEQTCRHAAERGLGWLERQGTEFQPIAAGAPLP